MTILVRENHRSMVVYGRQARQLVPFACIVTAVALERTLAASPRRRPFAVALYAAVLLQAAVNFSQPMRQIFPAESRRLAARVAARDGEWPVLLYADHIYPAPPPVPDAEGPVLLATPRPLRYLPYQYEG